MKEMIKKVREDHGGFTLAELLVVVAIVAVLVAIAVPVFSGSLNEASTAVENANQRSVKSEASTMYLTAKTDDEYAALPKTFYVTDSGDVYTKLDDVPAGNYTSYGVTYPTGKVTDATNSENLDIKVAEGTAGKK